MMGLPCSRAPAGTANEASTSDNTEWMPLMRPEDLPKGERKEFKVKGENVLLFWYRNEIYCIQSRSPAEASFGVLRTIIMQYYVWCYLHGTTMHPFRRAKARGQHRHCRDVQGRPRGRCEPVATYFSATFFQARLAQGFYSEGFMKAKFTQDYGIVCPTTGSVFSLKTGEVLDWYPNNPVLRALTPVDSVSKLKILPVKVTQDSIQIDASDLTGSRFSRGGADSSLENNNVFFSEPRVYIEGTDPDDPFNDTAAEGSGPTVANAATGASRRCP